MVADGGRLQPVGAAQHAGLPQRLGVGGVGGVALRPSRPGSSSARRSRRGRASGGTASAVSVMVAAGIMRRRYDDARAAAKWTSGRIVFRGSMRRRDSVEPGGDRVPAAYFRSAEADPGADVGVAQRDLLAGEGRRRPRSGARPARGPGPRRGAWLAKSIWLTGLMPLARILRCMSVATVPGESEKTRMPRPRFSRWAQRVSIVGGGLGGAIVAPALERVVRGAGAEVDDDARALRPHVGQHRAHAEEDALEVDVDARAPRRAGRRSPAARSAR